MSAKITRERLRATRIFNDHDLAKVIQALGGFGVFVGYRQQENGRIYTSAAWQVFRPGFQTDPKGHWRDYGAKTFLVGNPIREYKDPKRLEAIAWASKRYQLDPEDWLPSPLGRASGWFPGPDLRKALEAIAAGGRLSQADGSFIPGQEDQS
jgi:hypothetical protein